ncbi:1635_t:CDS:1 [Funneliformis geosporum]|nr:1635_t:CDS:1 [Funneliformis geosporum]
MYKLSAYYHAYAKQELPYYSIGKISEEICNILVDAYLNPDNDFIKLINDIDKIDNIEAKSFDEDDNLIISNVLNLNVNAFIKNLNKIIDDSENINMEEDLYNEHDIQDIIGSKNENNIEWDPISEADKNN